MDRDELIALRKNLGIRPVRVHSGAMSESQHQMAIFRWANLATNTRPELRWLHSIPNGGFRNKATAGRMKGEGAKAGVPDIFLDFARGCYHGLRLELKVPRIQGSKGEYLTVQAGKLSDEQEDWMCHYHEQGYCAQVAYGWLDAKSFIEDYLDDRLSIV